MLNHISRIFRESAELKLETLSRSGTEIEKAAQTMIETISNGGKLIVFGNGGSAADAQHFAAEVLGRFYLDRHPLPAVALTVNSSVLTALANDYGYEHVFSRQLKGLADPEDTVVGISTSGNSPNVLEAMRTAKQLECRTIGMTGADGGALAETVDICIKVPSKDTPRIQEVHTTILHALAYLVEKTICC